MSTSPSTSSSSLPESTRTTKTEVAREVDVDPGQFIRINARFVGNPERISFSFLPPGKKQKAVHDDYGTPGSKIERSGDLYSAWIDTRLMRGGKGWWYFYSHDVDRDKCKAKVGRFNVSEVPFDLIARNTPEGIIEVSVGGAESGLHSFGVIDDDSAEVGVAVGVGLGGLALLLDQVLAHVG